MSSPVSVQHVTMTQCGLAAYCNLTENFDATAGPADTWQGCYRLVTAGSVTMWQCDLSLTPLLFPLLRIGPISTCPPADSIQSNTLKY
jgi:hypothetical protein